MDNKIQNPFKYLMICQKRLFPPLIQLITEISDKIWWSNALYTA